MKLKPLSIKYSVAAVMLAVAGGAMAQGLNSLIIRKTTSSATT